MIPQPQINLLRGWPHRNLIFQAHDFATNGVNKVLSSPERTLSAFLYGADAGDLKLREQLALWHSKFYYWPPGKQKEKRDGTVPERKNEAGVKKAATRYAISGGASQGLACILQVFTDPVATKSVWFVEPAYMLAFRIFEDAGLSRQKFRGVSEGEDGEGIDVKSLRKGLEEVEEVLEKGDREGKALKPARPWAKHYRHIIYAVPTFSNPSSTVMSLRRRNELVLLARDFDALVITDDVYDQLFWHTKNEKKEVEEGRHTETDINSSEDGGLPPTFFPKSVQEPHAVMPRLVDVDAHLNSGTDREGADGFGNAVSNGSFSKICGPGLRTGWIESTEKFAYGFSQAGSNRSGGAASHLTATFLAELLEDGLIQKHIRECLRPSYAARYRMLLCAIERDMEPLGVTVERLRQQSDQKSYHHELQDSQSAATGTNGTEISEPKSRSATIAGGYFLWLKLPRGVDAAKVASVALEQENLIVAQGSMFEVPREGTNDNSAGSRVQAASNGHFSENLRLCLAWEDFEMLDEGIRRLKRAIEQVMGRSAALATTSIERAATSSVDAANDSNLPCESKSVDVMEKFR